jgi:prepilin-type N-terminal cleavage/methylation domain-containing protein/prepilin-type processing-associated H-X9-DG protein
MNRIHTAPSHRAKSSRHGFTLIELLVVIAIIALLENARKSSCANSIKQLALAAMQYTQDFDEQWWQMRDPNNLLIPGDATSGRPFLWGQILQPYVKSGQVLRCPSAAQPIVSYTCNMYLPNFSAGRALSDIAKPAQTPAFTDAVGVTSLTTNPLDRSPLFFMQDGNIYGRFVSGSPYIYGNNRQALADADRHLDGANYSFVDGHVKWMRPRSVPASWFTAFTPQTSDLLQPPSLNMDYNGDGNVGTATSYN